MTIPHEVLNITGVILGQMIHIIKKKTEESRDSEGSIFVKWILRRPVNTIAAALVGVGVNMGLTAGEVAQGLSPLVIFLQAVVTGVAANSGINRAGDR